MNNYICRSSTNLFSPLKIRNVFEWNHEQGLPSKEDC